MPENMFRRITSMNWTFVLILYTRLFLEAHAVSDTCIICSCSSTEYVTCSKRHLTSIPKNIPPNTKTLLLSYNAITNISKGAFENLQSLQRLSLYKNLITNIPKGAFKDLQNLQTLELPANSITNIGKGVFENLQSLQNLYLNSNSITIISKGIFEGLQSLRKLDLAYNSITTIEKGAFEDLQNLEYLYLSGNSITNITKEIFEDLQNLRSLSLSGTSITNIAKGAFENLHNLQNLDLSHNSITTITKGAFENLQSLRNLHLYSNSITDIAAGAFEDIQKIQNMHLHGNSITKIRKGVFENMPSLIYLDLCRNSITSIAKGAFDLPSLPNLCLSNNFITNIAKGVFENLQSLKSLILSDNYITDIAEGAFEDLHSLGFLDLHNNSLTNISKGVFENLPNLKYLVLSDNYITNIAEGAFEDLHSLEFLGLKNNRIEHYEDGVLLFLPRIAKIDLRGNKDMICGCYLPGLVNYMKSNYKRTIDVKGECRTDLGQKIPILKYSECSDYSLFPRNLQCQTCSGMMCNDSEVTSCPGAEPVCRLNLLMNGVTLKFERSCSTYKDCVEAMRKNPRTCNKWSNGTSCAGCCIGNLCNKNDFTGWTNSFEFHLIFKKLDNYMISDETISRIMQYELKHLTGTFKVEYCSLGRSKSIFTINCWILKDTTKDDLWHIINQVFTTSLMLNDMGFQQRNVELIDGMFCSENTTSNNGTFHWPATKVGTNATILCDGNVATRYCSSRTLNHLEMSSSQSMTSLKCSPFIGIWQEPDMSKCDDTEWTTRLKDIRRQNVDQRNIDNISKEVLNVSHKSVYFKKQDIDLAVDILERMVPFTSKVSSSTTINNILLSLGNIINTPEEVLVEAEQANGSVSRILDIIKTIPERIPLEEQQVTVSYSNLGIGVAKVNNDTFNGLFYGVSYGINETEANIVFYNESHPDLQQENIQTITFISIPESLPIRLEDEQRSAISRVSFFSMRDDKLYRVKQNFSTDANAKISSYILAADVPNVSITNLAEPVKILFNLINQNVTNPRCVYWDEHSGNNPHWSTKGCNISHYVPGKNVVCSCDHLTSFAVLMDVQNEDDIKNDKTLSFISVTGCGISFIFLILTVVIHVCFKNLWELTASKILVSLCVSLAVTNLIFAVGMQPYVEILAACKTLAVLLHYIHLTSFMWISVEAIHVFLSMVGVHKRFPISFMKGCSILACGLPAVIVIITLVINDTDYYVRTKGVCWLPEIYSYATVMVPVLAILIVNLTIIFLVIWCQISMQNNSNFGPRRRKVRVLGIVGLFFLLGLTWVLAFVAVGKAAEVFKFLFAIFNTLQGIFIFVFYCIYKKDTRDIIIRYITTRKKETFLSGRSTSSFEIFQTIETN